MSWAAEEFADLDLGDARRNKRLIKLAQDFVREPMAGIPSACGGWAETQAAYRFFGQDEMDWRDILPPHWDATQTRNGKTGLSRFTIRPVGRPKDERPGNVLRA